MIMNQKMSRKKQVRTTMGINVDTHELDDPFFFHYKTSFCGHARIGVMDFTTQ